MFKKAFFVLYVAIIFSGCSRINNLLFLQPNSVKEYSNITVSSQEDEIRGRIMTAGSENSSQSLINLNLSTENTLVAFDNATVCITNIFTQEKEETVSCVSTNSNGEYLINVPSSDDIDGQLLMARKQIGSELTLISTVIDKSKLEIDADPFTTAAAIMTSEFISEYSNRELDEATLKKLLSNLKVYSSQVEKEFRNKPVAEIEQLTKITLIESDIVDKSSVKEILNKLVNSNQTKVDTLKQEIEDVVSQIKDTMEDTIKNPITTDTTTDTTTGINKLSGNIIFSERSDGVGTLGESDMSLAANAEVCLFDLLTKKRLENTECVMTDNSGSYELSVSSMEIVDSSLLIAVKEAGSEINMVSAIINKEEPVMQVDPKTTVSTTFVIDMINEKETYFNNDFITLDQESKQSIIASAKQYYKELNVVLESETFGEFTEFTKIPASGVDFSALAISSISSFFKQQKENTQTTVDQLNKDFEANETIQNAKSELQLSTDRMETTSTIVDTQGNIQLVNTNSQTMLEFGNYLATLPEKFPDTETGSPYEYIVGIVDGTLMHLIISDQPAGLRWLHATDTNEIILYGFASSPGFFPIRIIFTDRFSGATVQKNFNLTIIQGTNHAPTQFFVIPNSKTLSESTDITSDLIVGTVHVYDDYLGYNVLELAGPDSNFFKLDMTNQTINLKAGTVLDYESNKQSYDVELILTDETLPGEFIITTNFKLVVTNSNETPIINDNSAIALECTENIEYIHKFDSDDPDTNDMLSMTLTGVLPAGVTFDSGRYELVGTPDLGTGGIYPIILTVRDSGNLTVSKYFNLVVHSSLLSLENSYNHEISNPKAMILDESTGTLYVIDDDNRKSTVYGIDINLGLKTTKGTVSFRSNDMALNEITNSLYISNRTGNLNYVSIDPWEDSTDFNIHVGGVSVGAYTHHISYYGDTLYVAQGTSCYIQKINLNQSNLQAETISGEYCSSSGKDGMGNQSLFSNIYNMVISHSGDALFIAENNKIRKIDLSNSSYVVSTLSPSGDNETFKSLDVDNNNILYGGNKTIEKISYYFDSHQKDQADNDRLIYNSDPIVSESVFGGRDIIDIAVSKDGKKLYALDSQSIYKIALP